MDYAADTLDVTPLFLVGQNTDGMENNGGMANEKPHPIEGAVSHKLEIMDRPRRHHGWDNCLPLCLIDRLLPFN